MKAKHAGGTLLIIAGSALMINGGMNGDQMTINAGIGGVFIGVVLLTFASPDYIKYDAFRAVIKPCVLFFRRLSESLELEGKAIYIPPYPNLRKGGIFIPLHEDFDIDLTKLDENTLFLTDVGREREMGLLLPPTGRDLVEMYESYMGMEFSGLNSVENAGAVLRSLGLAKSVSVEEKNDEVHIFIDGLRMDTCSEECVRSPCPVCGSVLLSIAKSIDELIMVERVDVRDGNVEIVVRRMGGISRWM